MGLIWVGEKGVIMHIKGHCDEPFQKKKKKTAHCTA